MLEVWAGCMEVTQIPGEQLITFDQGAAFTWFTCWTESPEGFEAKAVEVMAYYGLHMIGSADVVRSSDLVDVGEELLEQIERTHEAVTYALYRTFHGFPPRFQ
jgi:hypothetical protein